MSNENPFWLRVLESYYKSGFIQEGLTIPFLIGVESVIDPESNIPSIRDFMNEVYQLSKNQTLGVVNCSYLNEDVIVTEIIEEEAFERLDTELCENKITKYESLYGSFISQNKFSKAANKWGKYTRLDKKRIIGVFQT